MGKYNEFLTLFPDKPRTKTATGVNVVCPAHNDHTPSLSVSQRDGKILLHCQAGCETSAILARLGLSEPDLFLNTDSQSPPLKKKPTEIYPYHDESGRLLYEILRYGHGKDKTFKARRPDPDNSGDCLYSLDDTRRLLYNLPEVLRAVKEGRTVYVCEGEKDCNKLRNGGIDSKHLVATTNPFGAGHWKDSYSESLRDADIVIFQDGDEPGLKHGKQVAESVVKVAKSVKLIDPLPSGIEGKWLDVFAWLERGGDLVSLKRIVDETPEYKPDTSLNVNGVRTNIYEVYSRDNSYLDSNRDKSVTDSVTPEQDMSLSKRIVDWLKDSTGWCSYDDIDKDLNLSSAERTNRRQIIKRLKDSIVEANPKNNKLIRYINTDVRKIDFKSATKKTPLDIKFPFGIEQYFNIYSGNIVVVAGSPDAGKTAWILNLIRLNQDKHSIFYQCSEMDKEELASRLMNFEGIELDDWTFEAEKRSGNFADVIRPDCINIVDYMELTEDIYMVADYLKAIHEKLDSGIAIVALQKKIGANLGRGAEFSLEKPRLYLKMDAGETTIIKAKNWVRPDYNPNGLIIKYKIVGGCKFIITEDWYKPIQGAGK